MQGASPATEERNRDHAQKWIIVGGGYTGSTVAALLRARGTTRVMIARRTPGFDLTVDLDDRASCQPLTKYAHHAVVVHCAPPSSDSAEYNLVAAVAGAARLIYVSSTGVYGTGTGDWQDESAPEAPLSTTGIRRLQAERRLAAACSAAHVPLTIVRAAGIYGRGRGFIERARAKTLRVLGDGSGVVCRIHVEDLAAAIVALGEQGQSGTFNAVDSDPTPLGVVADAAYQALGHLAAPRISPEQASPELAAMLLANRKLSNQKLLTATGLALRYPSWRDWLAAELAESSASEKKPHG